MEWGEFRIGGENGLFEKIKVKSLKYKTADLPNKATHEYNLPALTAGIINQGLNNFVPKDNATILKNVISISANGANTGATFYQNKEFTVLQDAYAIEYIYTDDILTDNQYLYLTASISNIIYGRYDWSDKAGWEKIKNLKISLPTKNGKIDFEFMESFIQDLENQKINELNNYLIATGLKDYHLTSEEEKVLVDFENGKFEWGNFEIEKLFNISRGNISNQKELIKDNFGIVFVAQNDNDNGFVDIVKPENHKQFKGNSLIVGRQTGIVYYQEKDFITTDGVLVLSAKENFIKNRKIGLAFTSSLTKQMFSFGYNNTVSAEKLNKVLIQLPTNKNKPDYEIMEILISAVQKLVIKDVVIYGERKIGQVSI